MARTRNSETVYLMPSAPPGPRPGGRTYAQTRRRGHRQTHRPRMEKRALARRHLLRRGAKVQEIGTSEREIKGAAHYYAVAGARWFGGSLCGLGSR